MSQNSTHTPATENSPEASIIDTSASAQRARLLAALRRGPVTTLEARRDLNVFVPGVRVFELRQEGHPIVTRLIRLLDDQGRPHSRVAQYAMQGGRWLMHSPDKQRSPHEAGPGAHAGRLGASRDYTMEAAFHLAAVSMEAAQAQLEAWARLTDEPHWAVVDAVDLLDAARAALEGSR